MKKFALLSLVFFCSLWGGDPKYFIGASLDFGFPTFEVKTMESGNSATPLSIDGKSYMISFNGGVQQFWDGNEIVGGRALGEFGLGGADINGEVEGSFSLFGALDLLVDFYKDSGMSLGVFGGFEYGMRFLVSDKYASGYQLKSETYGAYWRVGASIVLGDIHRFEIMYRSAISPLAIPTQKEGFSSVHQVYSGSQVSVGYKIYIW